ncbi:hypothetical protein [Tateyamaria omphalii]|uniref:Uncharacterized protein n=1 Tax=Tateyamaria omphalii TaxID=299262 RepID=A0A1P8MTN1_9RHOB|nr:hypothetical protein [Tateyamaria omphalii]APX11395.1 hypothetical protein BWR18_06665 [Tateyamaria omphalii]
MLRFYTFLCLFAPLMWLNLLAIAWDTDLDLDAGRITLVIWIGAVVVLAAPHVLEMLYPTEIGERYARGAWTRVLSRIGVFLAVVLLFADPFELQNLASSWFSSNATNEVVDDPLPTFEPSIRPTFSGDTSLPVVPVLEPIVILEDTFWSVTSTILYMFLVVVFAAVCWRAYLIVQTWRTVPETQPSSAWDTLGLTENRRFVAERLHRRAQMHKTRGGLLLILIFCLIGLGINLYFTAGDLVSSDVSRDPLEQTLQLQSRLLTSEADLAGEMARIEERRDRIYGVLVAIGIENAQRPATPSEPLVFDPGVCSFRASVASSTGAQVNERFQLRMSQWDDLMGDTVFCNEEIDVSALLREDANLRDAHVENDIQLQTVRDAQNGIRGYLTDKMDVLVSPPTPPEGFLTQQLLASGLTRFGILFVIIYLVQILVGIYRYSMRQAEFFESRAASLVLATDTDADMARWRDEFISPQIDFGAPPRSPMHFFERIAGRRSQKDAE